MSFWKVTKNCSFLFFAFTVISASAATFDEATAEHKAKLESAIQRLNTLRTEIQDQQIPLAKRLSATRESTKELRREAAQLRAIEDSKHTNIEALKTRVDAQQKEYDYITRLLFSEYISTYEASLSSGERAGFGQSTRDLNLFAESEEATESTTLERSLSVIEESMTRIRSVIGGKSYSGESLDVAGKLVSGTFIQAGPVLFFVDEASEQAGIVEESMSLRPQLRMLGEGDTEQLMAFANGKSGTLPIDPSLQNALLFEETKEGFLEHLEKGGVWVYPIVFFALLATLVAVYKFAQIFAIRQPEPLVAHDISRLLREGKRNEAAALAKKQPQPARGMLTSAVEHADEPVELIEEVMYESMLGVQPKLERFLNVIAVTAATAPLLGLLGTVTGIIKTFKLMNIFGAGDPRPLISGISEALITTELGLVLAIPALIIHALLSRKVAGVMARMEKLSVALVNSLSRRAKLEKSDA